MKTPEPDPTIPDVTTALTSGRLLARNAGWNLVTQCAPMAVALLTIPVLLKGIGTDRFGVLTLAWIILGYFSLFDLGLGRALTRLVAETLGLGMTSTLPSLVWTALGLMFALGLIGTLLVGLISPWLVREVLGISGPLQSESLWTFLLMAAMLPFVISIGGLRGVMEAHQQFRSINVVRMATGLLTLVGPVLVLPFSRNLVAVVGIIAAGKLIAWLLYLVLCLRTVPAMRREVAARLEMVKPLICFGGWITVANMVSSIMVQMDRFLIGALLSTAAVAYYTTPFELVTKYWFLSNSVLGVIFPAFAASFARDRRRTELIFERGVKYVFLILFPLVLGTVALAPEVLTLWLGIEFARQSTFVLRCLALGVFLNGLAQVPSAMLQGVGRPDLTAFLHMIELPFYLVAAWFLIRTRGIEGAALAWTARTALDLVFFFGAAGWILPGSAVMVRRLGGALGLVVPVLAVCMLPTSLACRASFLLVGLTAASIVTWRRVLTPEEKAPDLRGACGGHGTGCRRSRPAIVAATPPRRNSRPPSRSVEDTMYQSTLKIGMYTPTSHGGHALYSQELLTAIAEVGASQQVAPELITCEDLADDHQTPYPIHRILPRQVPRDEFRTTTAWAASRLDYYARREHAFLDWVADHREIDLIHVQEYTPWLAPRHFRTLRRRGVPIVFTVHNIKHHYKKFIMHSMIRDFSFRSAWRTCDALLVHTEGLRAALSDFLAGSHPPIFVTPHGVWHGERPTGRTPQGNGSRRSRLLFFGVLRPNKGVHVLLQSLGRLPDCDLTIAGEAEVPEYLELIRRMIREFPPGRVELIDRYVSEDEMAALFHRSRVVILPYTTFTSQSGVLHQALAHGRPVVGTDVGALGECIRRWGIGGVVPPGDEQSLALAIEQFLGDESYKAAVEAIERVRGELTWTRMAEATIDVYRSIVG